MTEIVQILGGGSVVEVLSGNASVVDVGTVTGASPGFMLPSYTIESDNGFDVELGALPLTNTTGRTLNLRNVRVTYTDETSGVVAGLPLIVDVRKGATSIFSNPLQRPTIGVGQSMAHVDFPDVPWLANEGLFVDLAQVPSNGGRCKLLVQLWAD